VKTLLDLERLSRDQLATMPDAINLMARTATVEDLVECYGLHVLLSLSTRERRTKWEGRLRFRKRPP